MIDKNKLLIKQNKYDDIKVMADGKFSLAIDLTKHGKIITVTK